MPRLLPYLYSPKKIEKFTPIISTVNPNKKINLYNSGLNFRDFTYIDDVVKILLNLFSSFLIKN